MKPIDRVAVLHDVVGVGKCGMMNILPIMSLLGIEACPIPTMLFSTHTKYNNPAINVPYNYIRDTLEHYKKLGIKFSGILVGYIGRTEILKDVIEFIKYYKSEHSTKIIVDPIFGDNGVVYTGIEQEYIDNLKEILKYTDLLLPNMTEAKFLSEENEIHKICNKIIDMGCRDFIITGIEENDYQVDIYSYVDSIGKEYRLKKFKGKYHGTGDIFTGIIASLYLNGEHMDKAVKLAHEFIYNCIYDSAIHDYDKREGILLENNLISLVNLRRKYE